MNIKEVSTLLAETDKVGHVLLVESKHGIGKSTMCATYAESAGLHYEPLILSLYDTGDMIGMPDTTTIGGVKATTWAAPAWYVRIVNAAWPEQLKTAELSFVDSKLKAKVTGNTFISRSKLNELYCEHYDIPNHGLALLRQAEVTYSKSKRSMLFLDEMNRSAPDILNASLQLILEKRLNDHILPVVNGKETCLVAAINPSDQSYTVAGFDPALLDRFVYAKLETSTPEWLSWARSANINPTITSFITDNPTKLHFTPKDETEKGASNRSWARLSSYLNTLTDTTKANHHYITGTLGKVVGAEFVIYLQNYSKAFTIKDVERKVNRSPKLEDVEKLATRLTKHVEGMEAIKRLELAAQLQDKYADKATYTEALPYLAYLHALPLESLASYISKTKETNGMLEKLAELDDKATKKQLFHKIISHI